ncbi:hypothetical protein [Mucilaginibacter antarcticus]|uniref:Uncharacterized protein n=1 Tax=Mucilaginibacter antarcticus TaxID=1855725 RepID=A0ABW5XM59_9SPHI
MTTTLTRISSTIVTKVQAERLHKNAQENDTAEPKTSNAPKGHCHYIYKA